MDESGMREEWETNVAFANTYNELSGFLLKTWGENLVAPSYDKLVNLNDEFIDDAEYFRELFFTRETNVKPANDPEHRVRGKYIFSIEKLPHISNIKSK